MHEVLDRSSSSLCRCEFTQGDRGTAAGRVVNRGDEGHGFAPFATIHGRRALIAESCDEIRKLATMPLVTDRLGIGGPAAGTGASRELLFELVILRHGLSKVPAEQILVLDDG